MVEIKGLEKFSSRDFPGQISSTVFLGGCNFRCPYCHNADLVLRPKTLPTLLFDAFIGFLDARRGWLEGVCVTGGEPLLTSHLEELLLVIKERELKIKLDTNGSRPDRLKDVIRAGLVDVVAMDVKAPLERYREVTAAEVNPAAISESLDILRGSGLECFFRTTVVPGLVGLEDVRAIARMLRGAPRYVIQPFVPHNTLDNRFLEVPPYRRDELSAMAEAARSYVADVRIEGE
ncbi:MAG: anaerobic ribonucleoside-triphosphate reductase activating protein [Candidatus Aminicenantes bacterium]|nr:anaerobic ribonucleoside-triphosphate reductase activating protein [Candidatus Aminicenantes bacterium]